MLLRPYSIIEPFTNRPSSHYIVGYSKYLKNIAIEMGRNKSSTLEELKMAIKLSYNNFKDTYNCNEEPTLAFSNKNTALIWSCYTKIEEIGFFKNYVNYKFVTLENENIGSFLKTRQSENNNRWENAIEIIKQLDLKKQNLEKIAKFYEQVLYIDLNMYRNCRKVNLDSCSSNWYSLDQFGRNSLDSIIDSFDFNINITNEFVRELENQ